MTTPAGSLLVAAGAAPDSTQQAIGYPTLFLLVMAGALVPVVPTGAVVSSAGAVALYQDNAVVSSLLVFVVAALAAFVGDGLLYLLGQRGLRSGDGSRRLDWMRDQVAPELLARTRQRLERRGTSVLLVSRLVPGGRIPVMLACLVSRMPLRTFLRGTLPAALAWAATYQLIGVLGGTLFPRPWQGVAAAVALALLVTALPVLWRRLRQRDGARCRDAEPVTTPAD
ncbi:VTT domain-containing protein [Streptomyces sp. ACA25]|uniref:DedA family protein n=1 Tax=Streptomyces sp. ACA25 TaxID=3022596 RepID=UPI0023070146|nr:VTT domain-containing protein [Streptomyces sp. ACA25]MDB1089281.1 VTT domain-containing protein [Streptomyces sp. ACA25]